MSNYSKMTINPRTGEPEQAEWLDDYFGKHVYGIRFTDGGIYCENQVRVAEEEAERRRPKPSRVIKIIEGGNENHGPVGRDVATGERIRLCYSCGFPPDEHKPNCPEESETTFIEDEATGDKNEIPTLAEWREG